MRKKVLGKLSGLTSTLFGEKTSALQADISRLDALIASRRDELKQAGIASIAGSYDSFIKTATTAAEKSSSLPSSSSTAANAPVSSPKSATKAKKAQLQRQQQVQAEQQQARQQQFERMQTELQEVKRKLEIIGQEINVNIDKEINSRALAISETVTVVQEAVTKMMLTQ